jgi:predicted double-glycine peptidase
LIGNGTRILLVLACLIRCDGQAAELTLLLGDNRSSVSVKSLLEIRDENLVRQGWDISCGAAALSTILTYHLDAPYSELTIAVSILANTDPQSVKDRGGFSLLDLKRFAEAVGFTAKGFGGLSLDDLANSAVPVILPARIHGFDHFIIYQGRFAGRVHIGDPAFGNITFSEQNFAKIWPSGIGFFVQREGLDIWGGESLTPEHMGLVVPDLNYVYRLTRGGGPIPHTRRPQPTGILQ